MRVLILCSGNSCRSQMAEGLLKTMHPDWEVYSAGTRPESRVHPLAVEVMRESNIDLSKNIPKNVSQFSGQSFDYVITVCDDAKENCPVFYGNVRHRLHRSFEDPALFEGTFDEKKAFFGEIRDQIKKYLQEIFN